MELTWIRVWFPAERSGVLCACEAYGMLVPDWTPKKCDNPDQVLNIHTLMLEFFFASSQ